MSHPDFNMTWERWVKRYPTQAQSPMWAGCVPMVCIVRRVSTGCTECVARCSTVVQLHRFLTHMCVLGSSALPVPIPHEAHVRQRLFRVRALLQVPGAGPAPGVALLRPRQCRFPPGGTWDVVVAYGKRMRCVHVVVLVQWYQGWPCFGLVNVASGDKCGRVRTSRAGWEERGRGRRSTHHCSCVAIRGKARLHGGKVQALQCSLHPRAPTRRATCAGSPRSCRTSSSTACRRGATSRAAVTPRRSAAARASTCSACTARTAAARCVSPLRPYTTRTVPYRSLTRSGVQAAAVPSRTRCTLSRS